VALKIYLDTADFAEIAAAGPPVVGFTTNPSLMRAAGVNDYMAFARSVAHRNISLEVISDDWPEMERQARVLSALGGGVYVKIPVVNTRGVSSVPLIERLVGDGIKVNVTAVMTVQQARAVQAVMSEEVPAIISVFAGRIADTGRDPRQTVRNIAIDSLRTVEVLWASVRSVLDVRAARDCEADIITLPPALLRKYVACKGKDLDAYSRETVAQFLFDAVASGYSL